MRRAWRDGREAGAARSAARADGPPPRYLSDNAQVGRGGRLSLLLLVPLGLLATGRTQAQRSQSIPQPPGLIAVGELDGIHILGASDGHTRAVISGAESD